MFRKVTERPKKYLPSWKIQNVKKSRSFFANSLFSNLTLILQTCPSVVMGQLDKCLREVSSHNALQVFGV